MRLQKSTRSRLSLGFAWIAVLLLLPTVLQAQEKIAFQPGRDGNTEIYVMNTDGSNQTRLTYSDIDDADPAFSADGSKIVFTSFPAAKTVNNLTMQLEAKLEEAQDV
jgi:hypothetical protein